jgi:hypothetical protein
MLSRVKLLLQFVQLTHPLLVRLSPKAEKSISVSKKVRIRRRDFLVPTQDKEHRVLLFSLPVVHFVSEKALFAEFALQFGEYDLLMV